METIEMSQSNSQQKYPVLIARVWNANRNESSTDCVIQNCSIKYTVVNVASQLGHAIRSSGLLKCFEVSVSFSGTEAIIEFSTTSANHELYDFDEKIKLVRAKLRDQISCYQAARKEKPGSAPARNKATSPATENANIGFAENKNFFDFFTGQPGTTLELNLFEAGKEIIEASYNQRKATPIIDNKIEEALTGNIKRFDDKSQRATFHRIRGISGEVSLEVTDHEMREILIDAQRDNKCVTITYAPVIDPLHPGKRARSGRLKRINDVGPADLFHCAQPQA